MEGRRIKTGAQKRNPLYVMFLCLIAAVFILLIVLIVLGAKLGAADRALKSAEQQVVELQEQLKKQQAAAQKPEDTQKPDEQKPTEQQPSNGGDKKVVVDWLDLTGHSELTVLPESLFADYFTYYASDAVNLRAGPGTSHNKIQLVDKGTKVRAAAKDGEWTFVSVGNKFGWIKSEFLQTSPPAASTTTQQPANNTGSGNNSSTTKPSEATSGNLKKQ